MSCILGYLLVIMYMSSRVLTLTGHIFLFYSYKQSRYRVLYQYIAKQIRVLHVSTLNKTGEKNVSTLNLHG